MLTYVHDDLLKSHAQTLVNPVNTVGIMGKGLALRFKKQYPAMFNEYQLHYQQGLLTVGKLWLYRSPEKWILNFPTKQHWRYPSQLAYIQAGLEAFTATYADEGITSIAFPQLGCGAGSLDWETEVKPLMESCLTPLPLDIFIHIYP